MKNSIERRVLTEAVLTALVAVGKPVGDAEVPRGDVAGWNGQPNQDGTNFTPYVVVTPLQAGPGTGPFSDFQADRLVPYGLSSFGASREQCEWIADRVRTVLEETLTDADVVMWLETADQYSLKIQSVIEQAIGAITRLDQTEPPIYNQTDSISLLVTR